MSAPSRLGTSVAGAKDWFRLEFEQFHPLLWGIAGTRLVAVTVAETMQLESIEIIDLEEFAKRMSVARTTVFEWIKTGKLLPGRHFIRMGRVIRFEWGPDLLKKLYEDSDAPSMASHNVKPPPTRSSRAESKRKAAIDLDY